LLPAAVVVAALAASRPSAGDPLWQAEIRAGYGVAVSGAGAAMSVQSTPVTLAALGAYAFNDDPPLSGYGGLLLETFDRNAVGAVFGVTLAPHDSALRLSAGAAWLVVPYTLWGATASAGACMHAASKIRLCADLQLTAYVGGSDLGEGHSVTQGQLVGGVVFDAP
jgi:hypothetical protein